MFRLAWDRERDAELTATVSNGDTSKEEDMIVQISSVVKNKTFL